VSAVSSALLVAAADAAYGLGSTTSTLAFLAGVSGGLLPDVDSDESKPLRLSGIIAGLGAAALAGGFFSAKGEFLSRPWQPIFVFIAALAAFLIFNTLIIHLLKKHTVHRGLFHSLAVPFLYGGLWAVVVCGQGRKTILAVWVLAAFGVLVHLILDAASSMSFKPLKLATKDLAASTRLWMVTALVNFLALINPFIPPL
jgi:membrane-bound metal-dependent hydrolase YbcI (DUF457 family)